MKSITQLDERIPVFHTWGSDNKDPQHLEPNYFGALNYQKSLSRAIQSGVVETDFKDLNKSHPRKEYNTNISIDKARSTSELLRILLEPVEVVISTIENERNQHYFSYLFGLCSKIRFDGNQMINMGTSLYMEEFLADYHSFLYFSISNKLLPYSDERLETYLRLLYKR